MSQPVPAEHGFTPMDVPEEVLSRDLDGESVLLDLRSGRYFGLNKTGARVFAGLKNGLEREEIVASILEEFDVAPQRARADVDAFIAALMERGLLVKAPRRD